MISELSGTMRKKFVQFRFVRQLFMRLSTFFLLPGLAMCREYVSLRGRTHAVERRVHRRDIRYRRLISEVHAVVSVPKAVSDM